MYLTNGETAGKTVVLPANADFSGWEEITEEEYQRMQDAADEMEDMK